MKFGSLVELDYCDTMSSIGVTLVTHYTTSINIHQPLWHITDLPFTLVSKNFYEWFLRALSNAPHGQIHWGEFIGSARLAWNQKAFLAKTYWLQVTSIYHCESRSSLDVTLVTHFLVSFIPLWQLGPQKVVTHILIQFTLVTRSSTSVALLTRFLNQLTLVTLRSSIGVTHVIHFLGQFTLVTLGPQQEMCHQCE